MPYSGSLVATAHLHRTNRTVFSRSPPVDRRRRLTLSCVGLWQSDSQWSCALKMAHGLTLSEVASIVAKLKMYPYFDVANYILMCMMVREDAHPPPTSGSALHGELPVLIMAKCIYISRYKCKQQAVLLQRDRATRFSVEILQLRIII